MPISRFLFAAYRTVFSKSNPTGYAPDIDVIIVSTGANTAPRIAF